MLSIELTHVDLPTGSPVWQYHMFCNFELWRQAQQLRFTRNTVIEQNLGTPAACKIADLDIER
jgi:hypothetical protein